PWKGSAAPAGQCSATSASSPANPPQASSTRPPSAWPAPRRSPRTDTPRTAPESSRTSRSARVAVRTLTCEWRLAARARSALRLAPPRSPGPCRPPTEWPAAPCRPHRAARAARRAREVGAQAGAAALARPVQARDGMAGGAVLAEQLDVRSAAVREPGHDGRALGGERRRQLGLDVVMGRGEDVGGEALGAVVDAGRRLPAAP